MLCGQLRHQCFHSFCIADVTPQMDNARCTFAYTLFGLAGAADDINCRAGLSQHICDLETDPLLPPVTIPVFPFKPAIKSTSYLLSAT